MERIVQAKSDRAPATEVNNNKKRQMSPPVSVPGISRQLSPARSKLKAAQGASATQDDSTQENALEPPVKGSKNSTGPKGQKAQKAQKAHPLQPSPLSRASKDSKASKPPTASTVSKDLNVSQKLPEGSSEDSQSSDDEADVKVKEENEDSNVRETSVILKVPNAPRQFESSYAVNTSANVTPVKRPSAHHAENTISKLPVNVKDDERQRDDSFKQDTTPIASEYSARSADHGKSKVKLEKQPEKVRKAQKSPSSNMSPSLDTPLERSESASVPLPNPSKSTSMNLLSKLGLIVDGAKV